MKKKITFNHSCLSITFFMILMGLLFSGPLAGQVTDSDCLDCHSDPDLEAVTERGKTLTLHVLEDALKGSVHEDVSCTDCHTGEESFEDTPHASGPMQIGCTSCHDDIQEEFDKFDVHGKAVLAGNPRAPSCHDCHGGHQILPLTAADSVFSKQKQADTCGKCHGVDNLNVEEQGITKRNLITRYKASIHWQAILEGKNGATCYDCHGYHKIMSSASQDSGVSRTNVGNSCQKCHPIESRSFWSGAHGTSLQHGNNDVPDCTTCHGDHDMASLRTRIGDAKQWAATQVCIWCHGNERMMLRYGLDTTPVDSYMQDFHGLTQRGTMGASATCADCHDPHHSLPSDHPASRMHISNRGTACGTCHGKVTDSFALSFSHSKATKPQGGERIESVIRVLYILLILGTIGAMVLHNFLIWLHAVRRKVALHKNEDHVQRMNRFERVNHIILIVSFAILVVTGFALKYPETFWAEFLFSVGMTETIRGFIHRFAAITMTFNFMLYFAFLFFRKRGKWLLKEIMPRKEDLTEAIQVMKYYLGLRKEKVKFSTFNYAEKFEFWALVWGTLIMLLTGLFLWFPKVITASMPSWVIGVARVIHFYEAILATLAILIFHIFYTIFHPDEYPMNTSWLSGNITKRQASHHFKDEAIDLMEKNK